MAFEVSGLLLELPPKRRANSKEAQSTLLKSLSGQYGLKKGVVNPQSFWINKKYAY
jgi:hypothetical protein